MATTYKQLLRAKSEFESSLAAARDLRNQWLSAIESSKRSSHDDSKLSKKELEQKTKVLKNKLLAVKWDFEDLEELLGVYKHDNTQTSLLDVDETNIVEETRRQIGNWRNEVAQMITQMEDAESSSKLFNKHGITFDNPITTNTLSRKYERLEEPLDHSQQQDSEDVVQFDKNLVSSGRTYIVNNMLCDDLDDQNRSIDGGRSSLLDPSQVFNNLSRPVTTNVYMNPNDNEMILDMLETEYYNPPDGLLQTTPSNNSTRIDTMLRKVFDSNRNRFLGTILFLCSFPTLLILFMII